MATTCSACYEHGSAWPTIKNKIDPHIYLLLEAFARGVNSYIAEHRANVPAWIDHVSAEDIEAFERANYMRFYSSADGLAKLPVKRQENPAFGSNQWAVSRSKSANGRILHGESVHMPWANQFQLYEAHLITPGKLNAAGIGWFGSPFFLCGFTDKITWSITWNQPNIADVYEEKIDGQNPPRYLYDGEWRDMRVEEATFRVLKDGAISSQSMKLYYTHHGPVVKLDLEGRRAYSLKLPNFDSVNYSTGLYRIMKAHDLASFQEALSAQYIPRWNFLFTDATDLYWVHNAVVARRDSRFDKTKPLPGWDRDSEWGPYLPFTANPQITNPRSGYLQNCNNPPWVVTRDSGLKPLDPAPYYLSGVFDAAAGEEVSNPRGDRMQRILERPQGNFTVDDFKAIGFDTYVLAADVFVPLLLEAAAARQPVEDGRVSRAVELLREWDRQSTVDSKAYPYVHYFAEEYRNLNSPASFERFSGYRRDRIDVHSTAEQAKAWQAFERAVEHVGRLYGKRDVTWGELNGVMRGTWLPVGGTADFDVLHPDKGDVGADGRVYCDDGWGHIMIVMEGEPKQAWTLLPFGESENPGSPHYADQARLHSSGQLKRFWFTPEEILANTESVWGDRGRLRVRK